MKHPFSQWLTALTMMLCLASNAAAQAPRNDEEARVHFRLGTAYYDSGRFAQAAEEYKQAYDLSQRPELLYNLFLAYRDAGDIRNAAAALRQYLSDVAEVEERGKLEARLVALDKMIAEQPPVPAQQAAPTEQEAPAEPASEPPAVAAEAQPAQEKQLTWLPWTLVGAGAALVVTGISVGALGVNDESKLEKDCPSPDRCTLTDKQVDALKSSGQLKTRLGDGLWISGAVVAGVGVAFMFWKPWEKPGSASQANVQVVCSRTLCGGSYLRSF